MKRATRVAVIAALVLGVGGGVAWATGVVNSLVAADGTITACVQKDSFNTRIVPAGTACKSTEQLLTLNQKGVKGDQGIQGSQGLQGIQGSQGLPGAKGDAGDPGKQGDPGAQGDPGQSLTAEQLAVGDAHCSGNGGVAISPQGDASTVLGYVCGGKDGANGADGTNGVDGTNGTNGANGSNLVGSACALPDSTPGAVEMRVAGDGTIVWTCHTAGPPPPPNLCPVPLPTYANAFTGCNAATGIVSITCTAGHLNLDGIIANGCEFVSSPEVCNGIDDNGDGLVDNGLAVLPIANGTSGCVNGAFKVVSCNAGFANVNGIFGDGCEINLLVDPNNCGTPGNRVSAPGTLHANWACVNGSVVVQSCVAGWANANGSAMDGCESPLDPDPAGNTQATAVSLGSVGCNDPNMTSVDGAISNVNDNDWYVVNALGGGFCSGIFSSMFFAAGGVVYDVFASNGSAMSLAGNFTSGFGFYNGATLLFIRVHSVGGSGSYNLQFQL